ncbi:MAG TPA: c-type cytochrome [Gemmatimonadales bacterium]|jgi:hypothetical protein
MRRFLFVLSLFFLPGMLMAQALGHFPPDSLVNTKVIPHGTPVIQVIGMMRDIATSLGARCQFCHVGQEGLPLGQFDFSSDQKTNKLIARQMMRMVEEINRRVDTLPGRETNGLHVTCETCHRGVNTPTPLSQVIIDIATTAGADSATRAYRALRQQYYGRASYDFGERSLNTAAFRLARAGKFDEAFAMLRLNAEMFPGSTGMAVIRGNVDLMKGDTSAAAAAFREAIQLDPTNDEAKGRLRSIGQQP